jgi:hypothetical protein
MVYAVLGSTIPGKAQPKGSILIAAPTKIKGKMVDNAQLGTIWTDSELDLIVADYFAMFAADLAGRPYVKSQHNAILAGKIGRPRGSIEFKHQNISAVLDKLGMPWIPGYKPRRNFQGAIIEAIGRYLTREPAIIDTIPVLPTQSPPFNSVFVPVPVLTGDSEPVPGALRRLIARFDPVERDHRNRALGRAGESSFSSWNAGSSPTWAVPIYPGECDGSPTRMGTAPATTCSRTLPAGASACWR